MGELVTRRAFSTMKIGPNVKDTKNGVVSLVTRRRFFQDGGFMSYPYRYVVSLTLCAISTHLTRLGTTRPRLGCAEGQTHTRTSIHICALIKDRNTIIISFELFSFTRVISNLFI